jgi:hypothetical protein
MPERMRWAHGEADVIHRTSLSPGQPNSLPRMGMPRFRYTATGPRYDCHKGDGKRK